MPYSEPTRPSSPSLLVNIIFWILVALIATGGFYLVRYLVTRNHAPSVGEVTEIVAPTPTPVPTPVSTPTPLPETSSPSPTSYQPPGNKVPSAGPADTAELIVVTVGSGSLAVYYASARRRLKKACQKIVIL